MGVNYVAIVFRTKEINKSHFECENTNTTKIQSTVNIFVIYQCKVSNSDSITPVAANGNICADGAKPDCWA